MCVTNNSGLDPGDLLRDADIHPVYGPLPDPPPPTSSQKQQLLKQNHRTVQSTGSDPSTHIASSGHGGQMLRGPSASSGGIPHTSVHNSVCSSQGFTSGTRATDRASVSSTSSSSGGQDVDSGHRHPSPPFHSNFSFQNGNGTTTGGPTAAQYYPHQQPLPSTTAVSAGNSYQVQLKGYPPHNYPIVPKGTTLADQHGAAPSYVNRQQQYSAGMKHQQQPYSPSWPSTYSSSSSQEQPSYGHSSFYNASISNGGARQPMMPHPPQGQVMTPSFSDSSGSSYSGTSSDYSHSRGSGSSTSTAVPTGEKIGSKDDEKSVEPNILRFTYAELSEATGGFVKGMVGLGSFGTVFRAKVRGNGPYAVKKLYSVSANVMIWQSFSMQGVGRGIPLGLGKPLVSFQFPYVAVCLPSYSPGALYMYCTCHNIIILVTQRYTCVYV